MLVDDQIAIILSYRMLLCHIHSVNGMQTNIAVLWFIFG